MEGQRMNAQVNGITVMLPKQTDPPRSKGGREATGPVEAGQRPTPVLARGIQTESTQEADT